MILSCKLYTRNAFMESHYLNFKSNHLGWFVKKPIQVVNQNPEIDQITTIYHESKLTQWYKDSFIKSVGTYLFQLKCFCKIRIIV